jgi:hypothetical protein
MAEGYTNPNEIMTRQLVAHERRIQNVERLGGQAITAMKMTGGAVAIGALINGTFLLLTRPGRYLIQAQFDIQCTGIDTNAGVFGVVQYQDDGLGTNTGAAAIFKSASSGNVDRKTVPCWSICNCPTVDTVNPVSLLMVTDVLGVPSGPGVYSVQPTGTGMLVTRIGPPV